MRFNTLPRVLLILLAALSFGPAQLQAAAITGATGPGGIGRTDVSSSLLYWLEADSIGVGNGNPVSTWSDTKTFSANNFSQATTLQKPLLNSTGINGRPSVSFDGVPTSGQQDKLVLGTSTTPRTILAVNTVGVTQAGSCCVGLIGSDGGDFGIRRESSNVTTWRGTLAQTPTLTVGSDFTFATGSQMFINGVNTATVAEGTPHILTAVNGTATAFGSTGLGDYFGSSGARPIKAQVGEVIAYDSVLTATQRVIVENYLSAKFNVGSTPSGANNTLGSGDHYAGDLDTLGQYDFDVFGLGNDGVSQVTSSGAEGFGIEQTSLSSGAWIFAGHTSAANGVTGPRWTRSWYVDATNVGSANLAFDWDDANMTGSFNANFNALMYRATEAGFFSVVATGVVNSLTHRVDFANVTLPSGYYTLAEIQVPEPSTLALLGLGGLGLLGRVRRRRAAVDSDNSKTTVC